MYILSVTSFLLLGGFLFLAAMSKIGGTAITTDNYLWTSTQYTSYDAWLLHWRNGGVDYSGKTYGGSVRAVCAF